MRQLFISYARENRPDVEALVRDLDALGYQTWVDSSLRGGQTWWHEILRRIGNCDVFVAIVSGHTLSSVACKRELEWALVLNKPVLPLAVERLPDALPRTLSMRQIIDYSRSGREAAFALAGALGTLPAAPPPPEQLPEPPPAPLSYLSDLVEQVGQSEPLMHDQQRQILIQLQPALRSADSEERRGGRYVLDMFSKRDDLYADVDRNVAQLGLTDRDAQRPVAPEAPEDSHDEHALTTPEVPAEGHGNLLADQQWLDALSAFFAKRWPEAVQRFEALQARYPGEHRVETRLTEARRQRDIDDWSSKAESAAADDDWATVVTALENLTGLDPNYPDVAARLEQARIAQRCKALVDEMTALHQAGRWQAVVAAAEELARLDPDHPDPGGIVSDAQAKIREADLADRYAQALNHLDQEHWQQAAELFTAIEQEQPGFRDAAALLTIAQQKLREPAEVTQRATPRPPPLPQTTPSAPENHYTAGSSGRPKTLANPQLVCRRRFHCGHRRGPDHLGRSSKLEVVEHVDIDLDINVHGNHFGCLDVRSGVGSQRDDRRLHQEKQHPGDDDHPRHAGRADNRSPGSRGLDTYSRKRRRPVFRGLLQYTDRSRRPAQDHRDRREVDGQCRYRQAAGRRTR